MKVLEHGPVKGPTVVALHGGPGAPGYLGPLARNLAGKLRVLEPWQRRSGGEPLTVARHVEDLRRVLDERCPGERPALLGHSWGAMLALAFGAAHPERVGPLALLGCGTFDPDSRRVLQETRERRLDGEIGERLRELSRTLDDPDELLRAQGQVLLLADSHNLASTDLELGPCDARGHEETWADMLRLQEEGVYPAAFTAIRTPVLLLHGSEDPHPGRLIHRSLQPYLPQIEYRELSGCGHYSWLEKADGGRTVSWLLEWLQSHLRQKPPTEP